MERTYTFNNSTVRILFGNILDSTADVIVSSDDSRLSMSGGISKNILKKAGPELARDVKKMIPATLGSVVVTTAGALPYRYIFHTITIDAKYAIQRYCKQDEQIREVQQYIVKHSVKQCLKLMPLLHVSSIAFPAIGAGAAKIPYDIVAQYMAEAISEILLASNKPYNINLYLYDKFETMQPFDFIPFFEHFASVSFHAEAVEQANTPTVLVEGQKPPQVNLSQKLKMNHQIFISYSRKDYEVAKGICNMLSELQIPYWIDLDGVYSGEHYKEVIIKAIMRTKIVLFLSSENSNSSHNVIKEIGLADKYNKTIIPVRIDNTPFTPKIEYDLNCIDYIDYTRKDVNALDKLKKTILGKLVMNE